MMSDWKCLLDNIRAGTVEIGSISYENRILRVLFLDSEFIKYMSLGSSQDWDVVRGSKYRGLTRSEEITQFRGLIRIYLVKRRSSSYTWTPH